VEDIEACIQLALQPAVDLVITVTPARRSPYFNMIVVEDGYARVAIRPTAGDIGRRQDAPRVYDMTTVAYAAKATYVLATNSLIPGRVKVVVVPEERALDIDTELDLEIAALLLSRRDRQDAGPAGS